MLARFRVLVQSFGLILNLRRVWLLVIMWAILANFAFQTQRDLFFRLSYLIVLVVAVSFLWALYSIQSFHLKRKLLTPRTQVGHVAEEEFSVVSTGRLPKLFIELKDHSELPGYHVSRVLSALSPRVRYNWDVRTLCLRRGRYRLGPISVASGDPFGLFLFRRTIPNSSFGLTVYPRVYELTNFAPPFGELRGGESLRRRTQAVTSNVSGTREYTPGDSFRRIHWPSSARQGRLIVKEFELDPTSDVWIFLDMERAVHHGAWWEESVSARMAPDVLEPEKHTALVPNTEEYAVTLAASIAKYYLDRRRAVGMVAIGDQPTIVQPDRGERQLPRLLEMLGVLAAKGRIPLAQVLAEETPRLQRNLTLVLITPAADTDWIRYAHHLQQTGQHIVTVLLDVSTFGAQIQMQPAIEGLAASGIPTYIVREGDDIRASLATSMGGIRTAA